MTNRPPTTDETLDAANKEISNALDALGEALDQLAGIDTEAINGWQAARRRKMHDHAQRAVTELYGWNKSA